MKLVNEYDPILNKECQLFDFENPIMDPKELADSLQRVRKLGKGVGLAAPQVGIDTKVLVIGMSDFETEGVEDFEKVFFNPKIKKYVAEKEKDDSTILKEKRKAREERTLARSTPAGANKNKKTEGG